ncbi:MAG: UDP-N-acetylmuramoyl-L-alanyl-D-glutamate--2,6-diaminopimelate ligase [Bdellovibrionales bacterium]|nr:UDP-N-acetylmuramoyl-L-alanyl-D-glutamate--2,6-diaminopimelate ligase [Bdellovibrionales bacterium]
MPNKKSLGDVFSGVPLTLVGDSPTAWETIEVTGAVLDSRQVVPGSLFLAVKGAKSDSHAFIPQAIENGAAAVLVESRCIAEASAVARHIPVFATDSPREAHARVAANLFEHPSSALKSIAVTGTNGKTSVSWIAANLLAAIDGPSALIGTLGTAVIDSQAGQRPTFRTTDNTTPDPLSTQRFLAEAKQQGARSAVLEATSQGLVQQRTRGMQWDCGIFTNLTRDHLDLHGDLETYARAKATLFEVELAESRKSSRIAVLNIDDPIGARMHDAYAKRFQDITVVGYSTHQATADALLVESLGDLYGTRLRLRILGHELEVQSRLVGAYNASNILATLAALVALGYKPGALSEAMSEVAAVPGRLELVAPAKVHVFVDYAHTPDALVTVQQSLRPLCSGRLITVFGCGGDRDRGKRPLMGQAVAELSDIAIVTSDNPRTEDPHRIISDILPGLSPAHARQDFRYEIEVLRDQAIHRALELAESGDAVLIAGKGHEPYQEICGVKHPFDDREVCLEAMRSKGVLKQDSG